MQWTPDGVFMTPMTVQQDQPLSLTDSINKLITDLSLQLIVLSRERGERSGEDAQIGEIYQLITNLSNRLVALAQSQINNELVSSYIRQMEKIEALQRERDDWKKLALAGVDMDLAKLSGQGEEIRMKAH
jgi:hypothetical protein